MASGGQNTRHYAPFPLRGYKFELSSSNRKPAQRIHRRGVTQYVGRTLGVQTKVVKLHTARYNSRLAPNQVHMYNT
jgi:hypothetical protein